MESTVQAPVESGHWEGQYLDVNGFRGQLSMDIDAGPDAFRGRFRLEIRDEDEPVVLTGSIEAVIEDQVVDLRWHRGADGEQPGPIEQTRPVDSTARGGDVVRPEGAQEPVLEPDQRAPVESRAVVRSAGSYALQAMVGTAGPVPGTSFGGGAWVLWRFADAEGR